MNLPSLLCRPLSLLHHFRPSRLLPPPPPLRLVFVGYNGARREHGDGGPSRETFDLGSEAPSYGKRGPLPPFLRRLVGCAYVRMVWDGMVYDTMVIFPGICFLFCEWYRMVYTTARMPCRCTVFFFFGLLVRAYWYYTYWDSMDIFLGIYFFWFCEWCV